MFSVCRSGSLQQFIDLASSPRASAEISNTSAWLHWFDTARTFDRMDIMSYMVDTWVTHLTEHQYTPLMDAAYHGDIDMCRILLMYDTVCVHINQTDVAGRTALNYAHIGRGNNSFNICSLLLHHKANVQGGANMHSKPIFLACHSSDPRFLELYCALEFPGKTEYLNMTSGDGYTPLGTCVRLNYLRSAETLLRTGHIRLEQESSNGFTPLQLAIRYGQMNMTHLLLRAGCSPTSLIQTMTMPTDSYGYCNVRPTCFFACYITIINHHDEHSPFVYTSQSSIPWKRLLLNTPIGQFVMQAIDSRRDHVTQDHLPCLPRELISIIDEYWWECHYDWFLSLFGSM